MPPSGWFYVQPETKFRVKTPMGFQLVPLIREHRIQNKLGRTETDEIWEDIEAFTYNRLRGKSALWTFCNPKMPRPAARGSRVEMNKVPAPRVQMPMKGSRTKPLRPTGMERHRVNSVAELRSPTSEPTKPKKPCKTCGGRKKQQART